MISIDHPPRLLAAAEGIPFLFEIMVFLIAAVVVVPAVRALKVSPILGYLVAGVIVGPSGIALIRDAEGVMRLAELGVVFLLFTIGLELSFDRLKAMRRYVFGYGLSQVLVTAAVAGGVIWALGLPLGSTSVLALGLALSSTAIVTQLLRERGELTTRHGRATFSVLLMQDLAVIPILLLVTLLGMRAHDDPASMLLQTGLKTVAVVAVIYVLGRYVLRWLYRTVARAQSPELLMAMTLLAVLATAWATGAAGLSMALGAFLSGLLLSETEFRHQIEADIAPFKGLLLGLFFISVGMSVDLATAAAMIGWVLAGAAALIVVKAAIATGLARLFGLTWAQSVRSGLLLAQAGEFLFVVIDQARDILPPDAAQFALIVASLSMLLTPFLALLAGRLGRMVERRGAEAELGPDDGARELEGHVVISGFGRVGETIARLLAERGVPYVAIDNDATRTRFLRARGEPIFFGDVTSVEVLEGVGCGRAALTVITVNDHATALRALAAIRSRWPDLTVFARARDLAHGEKLAENGATAIVPETLEASLQLSGRILNALGEPMESVNALIGRVRAANYAAIANAGEGDAPAEQAEPRPTQ